MSAAAHVVVISADLRRATVKVSPGTYLIDVLDESCTKLRLTSDKYLLRHKQKQINLSLPFRNSGLITGAKLELVPKSYPPEVVQVALQLPDQEAKLLPADAAGRLVGKFRSDTTLWTMLRKLEQSVNGDGSRKMILTTRSQHTGGTDGQPIGQAYFEMPVFNVMGRELASMAVLVKTLSQLGFNSGNVLMRLSFRPTEIVMDDAIRQLTEPEGQTATKDQEVENAESRSQQLQEPKPDQSGDTDTSTNAQDAQREQPNQSPTATQKDAPLVATEPLAEDAFRPVAVFLAPTGSTPAAALRPAADDDDFTPTIAHAQLHQARLQKSSRNKRLLSDKELAEQAAAEEARIAAVKSVVVRVRFPDNTSSEWRLGPDHSAAFLYDAIRHVMANNQQPFRLILPGGKTAIYDVDESLIRGYGLSGRVLVNLVWDDKVPSDARKQPFLRSDVAHRGQELQAPEISADAESDAKTSAVAPVTQSVPKDEGEKKGDGGGKKIPKWLKLSRK
ncbi:hypothetical protein CP533_3278 [Ophiocordyceps camponoti-saundersi (nom. inval.)]|nr:hypothetical protein CP533_3278 [Ophiocordyceps camponoti-saundersi (nom. inval.)]